MDESASDSLVSSSSQNNSAQVNDKDDKDSIINRRVGMQEAEAINNDVQIMVGSGGRAG